MKKNKTASALAIATILGILDIGLWGQQTRSTTYCNPLDVDYTYMIYNSDRDISYRSGADQIGRASCRERV